MSYKLTGTIYIYLTYTMFHWKNYTNILKTNPIYCQNRSEINKNNNKTNNPIQSYNKHHFHLQQFSAGCLTGFLSGILTKRLGKIAIVVFICIFILSKTKSFYHLIKPWNILIHFSRKVWLKKRKKTKEMVTNLLLKDLVFKSSFAAAFGFGFLYS
ncbi:uncharacterized protein T551_02653 [Pneumocystis jirovecii RU7]|uniref:FUN14 domain-containing protein n=1 Tax=Pneumocystis jirovecii (strain RU7) TaxID=1408657 RepID=A0A0W4ZIN6_PNEJ7|nr:uncharacterized protein T551_02653 [Pneumocystis jirovecii RU7]KTW28234.1 hypothetical protein T551_02653 [Pneumocystis jirovecii RU7]